MPIKERRALLGDAEAQRECTEKGIVLPCPFCGNTNIRTSNWGMWRCWCPECRAKSDDCLRERDAVKHWNTRPAPPIGRCGECRAYTSEGPGLGCCSDGTGKTDAGLVLHLRKEQNPLKGVPRVIADEIMQSVDTFLRDAPQQPVRRVLHLSEWMAPPWLAKNEASTVWKTPKNAFGYPKAMLAKTVPLDLDDHDVMLQIKQWAEEMEEERWRILESLGIDRQRLRDALKELTAYRAIGSVGQVRLLHNRFGKEVEDMECRRPSWSDRETDFCPCDNPEYGKNPGENKNPCEDCTHYTDKDE